MTDKNKIKLTEMEYEMLLLSSAGCKACESLLDKYNKNEGFDLYDLTLREMIHIHTTTRKNFLDLFKEIFLRIK